MLRLTADVQWSMSNEISTPPNKRFYPATILPTHVKTFGKTEVWVYRIGHLSVAYRGPFNPSNSCNLLARERSQEKAIAIAEALLETLGEAK
jgi:hypothetical protein